MRYLVAIICPPLAILMCKRPGHALINLPFWLLSFPLLFFMGFGVIVWAVCFGHAMTVCKMSSLDKRMDRLVQAIQSRPEAMPAPSRPA